MGMQKDQWKAGMKICSRHDMITVRKTKEIMRNDKSIKLTFTFDVPDGKGISNFAAKKSTTAKERKVMKDWTNLKISLNDRRLGIKSKSYGGIFSISRVFDERRSGTYQTYCR
jgi:hypothetical protein